MTLIDTYKKGIEQLDEFPHVKPWELEVGNKFFVDATPEDLKVLLKFLSLELLKAVEEWAKSEGFKNPAEAGQFALHADGYNQALEDLLDYLKEQREEIGKI